MQIYRWIATGSLSVPEPTVRPMRSAGRLVVDPRIYAGEIARFTSHVVCGPAASDCSIWTAAIGADGYGRNSAELHSTRHSPDRHSALKDRNCSRLGVIVPSMKPFGAAKSGVASNAVMLRSMQRDGCGRFGGCVASCTPTGSNAFGPEVGREELIWRGGQPR